MDNFTIINQLQTIADKDKLDQLLLEEIESYKNRTKKSYELYQRALKHVPAGISSDYQLFEPYPFYVDESNKSSVIDVDGNNLIDFHGGFGVTLFGYKHPLIVETTTKLNSEQGFLVSVPTTTLVEVSETMTKKYGLPYWRFTCSGTESTLDAIRLGRARHSRQYIIKIESGYHGHHDAVWVSVHAGLRADISNEYSNTVFSNSNSTGIPSVPYCGGIPENVYNLTLIAEFNNIKSVENLLKKYPNQVACVIVEPILLNCSMIKPKNGFLQSLIDLCRSHEVVVIFDLVKINTAINMKHIVKYWSTPGTVGPDMYTFGKGLSGGSCPCGGIGMTEEFAQLITARRVQVAGTYFGNSYALGLVRAVQNFVTEEEQEKLESLSAYMYKQCKEIIDEKKLPVIIDYVGNKGCLTFLKKGVPLESLSNYQEYIRNVDPVLEQLFVFFFINRGLWVQPRDEWSVSYQHTKEDIDKFVATFKLFAEEITA